MSWQGLLSVLLPWEQLCFPLQFRATPPGSLQPCIFPYPVQRRRGAQADSTFISLHLLFMPSPLQCSRGQINHAQACKKKKKQKRKGGLGELWEDRRCNMMIDHAFALKWSAVSRARCTHRKNNNHGPRQGPVEIPLHCEPAPVKNQWTPSLKRHANKSDMCKHHDEQGLVCVKRPLNPTTDSRLGVGRSISIRVDQGRHSDNGERNPVADQVEERPGETVPLDHLHLRESSY